MSDPEFVDRSQIERGPIRPESLPPELLVQIQAIYEVLGPYLAMTLEEFELGFLRDADPDCEVDIWLGITAVWIDYHETYLDDVEMSDADEQKLLSALIDISAGMDDAAKLGVPVNIGRRLLECFARFEDEIDQAAEEDEG